MKKNNFLINLCKSCFLISFITSPAYSQLVINNSMTPTQLVNNVFISGAGAVSGITYTGASTSIVGFSNGNTTNLGISSGILLCTGNPAQVPNVASEWMQTDNVCVPESDPDIFNLVGTGFGATINDIHDACVLEFDFTPTNNVISFRYVFASEEYPSFTCSMYNDMFGFFLTGPNPSGGNYTSTNIALVPGTTLPVGVMTINSGIPSDGNDQSECTSLAYSNLFVDNETGSTIAFDGFTTVLTATANVVPCEIYHIKLAVAEVADAYYDSGVFLEANSLDVGSGVIVSTGYINPSLNAIEGCNNSYLAFVLPDPASEPTTITYTIGGTAINGVDYQTIPTTVTIPTGSDSVAVIINPILDGISEGNETVIFSITDGCSNAIDTIFISDNLPLTVNAGVDSTICYGTSSVTLHATVSGGVPPYSYIWNNGAGATESVVVHPPLGTTNYTVSVNDVCGSASDQVAINVIYCCSIDSITSNISPCTPTAGNYSVSGQVFFTNAPISGTLTITNNCGGTPVILSAPFTSPVSYTFNNLTANAASCQINAIFSASSSCTLTKSYTAPTTITVTLGNTLTLTCSATSGTISATSNFPVVTYAWSGPGIVSGANTSSPIVNMVGVYTVTVTDPINGCTASGTVNVISDITPPTITNGNPLTLTCQVTSGTISVTATPSSSSYLWTGPSIVSGASTSSPTVNMQGVYNVVVTNSANGCTSTSSTTVLSNIISPNLTMGPSMIIPCNPHIVNISAISTTPSVTYNWTGPSVTNGNNTSTPTVNQPGLYTVVVTNPTNGCTSSGTVNVIPASTPVSSISDYTNVSCNGGADGSATVTVSGGTPPYTYQWNDEHAQILPTAINLNSNTWSVVVTDASGCTSSSVVTISEPNVLQISANQNINSCYGQPVNIAVNVVGGTPNYTYLWSNNGTLPSIIVYPQPPDSTFSLLVTDQNGCTAYTAVTVHVSQPVNISLFTNTDSICSGESVILTPTISGGVAPYTIRNQDNQIVTPPISVYPSVTGIWSISVEDACGTKDTGNVYIHVLPLPSASIIADKLHGCQPLTVYFNETTPDTGKTYKWNFENENYSNYSTGKNPVHTFTESGIYDISLTITSKFGCKKTYFYEEMITVYPLPIASFYPTPQIASIVDANIYFENYSIGASLYYWSFGDGDSSIVKNPTHDYSMSGLNQYTVQLIATTENECKDTIVRIIKINDQFTFYAPNAFTPNNDGINDIFYVVGNGIDPKTFKMYIYDRWGEKIYETNEYSNEYPAATGWDGKIKDNKISPIGSYSWIVIYKNLQGIEYQKAGMITLIR